MVYYSILFYSIQLVSFFILLNNFRNLFIFCINFDIDKALLTDKNKGLGFIALELFPFVILKKAFWFLLLILLDNFRILFIFCINVDSDEVLLFDKKKGLGFNSFGVISLCNS